MKTKQQTERRSRFMGNAGACAHAGMVAALSGLLVGEPIPLKAEEPDLKALDTPELNSSDFDIKSPVPVADADRSEYQNLMATDPVDEFRNILLERLADRLQQLYGSRCGATGVGFRPDVWADEIGDEVALIAGEIAFRPKEVDDANIVAYTAAMRAFLFRQHPEDLAPLRQQLNELFSLTYQQWELWDQIGQAGYHHLALAEPWVEWTLARITFGPVKDSTEVTLEDFRKRLRSDAKEGDPTITRIEGILDALRKDLGERKLRLVLGELSRYGFVEE